MRRLSLIALLTACLVAFVLILTPAPADAQSNPDQARALLAALNQWRVGLGLSPFRTNPLLDRMALEQTTFVLGQNPIPGGAAIHIGPRGDDPRTRALFPENNWAVYGQREQLVFTEIAALQPNVSRAVAWWQGSDIHNRAVTNGWYREVGIAAVPYRLGFAYLVVLAAQPNVLPALADPRAGVIYLSTETYPRGQGSWIRNVEQVRVFEPDGRPLTDWLPWAATIPIPPTTREMLVVAYRTGNAQALAMVSLRPADIALPQYADAWGAPAAPSQAGPVVVSAPTVAGLATNTPAAPPTSAPIVPTAAGQAPAATAALPVVQAAPGGPSVTLVYDLGTLTLFPDRAGVNVSALVLTNGQTRITIGNINAQFLRGTLTALGARDCIFITTVRTQTRPTIDCGFTSTTFLTPDRALWQGDFRVERNNQAIGQCRAADRRCVVGVG